MPEAVCAFCGKIVLSEVEVREGEKLFHLDCYRLYKRQAAPLRDQEQVLTVTRPRGQLAVCEPPLGPSLPEAGRA